MWSSGSQSSLALAGSTYPCLMWVAHGVADAERPSPSAFAATLAESAGWDRELLAIELPQLAEILVVEGLDVSITGFSPVEIDQLTVDFEEDPTDPDDTSIPRGPRPLL